MLHPPPTPWNGAADHVTIVDCFFFCTDVMASPWRDEYVKGDLMDRGHNIWPLSFVLYVSPICYDKALFSCCDQHYDESS